ncbi:Tigger transposable element-derived protein 1-like 169 [Homarus americanus]|uniref:Tigger transposable element-derived protein 1-like 169 n=1 Tax=Homarus americanus TaxID=6706 RepID=A0A8J5MU30_HOMAM|nr:Tigger transposable element-derived protein 1-like 169 [Homarus americanus]
MTWKEVTVRCLCAAWRPLWPECVLQRDFEGFEESEEEAVVHEIVALGNSMGLEVDDDDVEELVEKHSKELSTEELLELHKEENETLKRSLTSEESGEEEDKEESRIIPAKDLKDAFFCWSKLSKLAEDYHPDVGSVQKAISKGLSDMQVNYIEEFLGSHMEGLTKDDLQGKPVATDVTTVSIIDPQLCTRDYTTATTNNSPPAKLPLRHLPHQTLTNLKRYKKRVGLCAPLVTTTSPFTSATSTIIINVVKDPPLAASAALPGSLTASASTPPPGSPATPATPAPPGVPSTSTMTVTAFWKNYNICQAVNFFVKAWGNTTKATVRHAWSALLPQLKSVETKRQQPAELMNQVLETVRSIPAPGFQEVTREDLEELMQEVNTNDVEDLLEDEEGGASGDAVSDAGETEQRKVMTQKLSLLLGVCTSLQEMIQDIESESGEREQMIGFVESISRKYQKQ